MDEVTAREILGLRGTFSSGALRRRYRLRVAATHPDRSPRADADAQTKLVIQAFNLLLPLSLAPKAPIPVASVEPQSQSDGGRSKQNLNEPRFATVLDSETISLDSPSAEAFRSLTAVGQGIGSITYIDRENELLEVLLTTTTNDAVSLVVTLQGRSNGSTEAFLTVEPIGLAKGPLPSITAITELLVHNLNYQHYFAG